jgi:hypothetical protein
LGIDVRDEFTRAKPFADRMKVNYPLLDANNRQDVEDAFAPMWGAAHDGDRRAGRQGGEAAFRHRHQGAAQRVRGVAAVAGRLGTAGY